MKLFYRNSHPAIKWWYQIDHNILFVTFIIMLIGVVMAYSASTAVAERIGLPFSYFYGRHIYFVSIAFVIMLIFSSLSIEQIRTISIIGILFTILLVFLVLFAEPQLKGAKRWLKVFGFSIQPSEFVKPFFIVINSWFLSRKFVRSNYQGYLCSVILLSIVLTGLILQPDFGMVLNFSAVWLVQLYLSMVSYWIIFLLFLLGIGGVVLAYYSLAHVQYRIDKFLFSGSEPSYQIRKSLDAIHSGGFFGKGLFEGKVKTSLPDAHTDFIFAVMVEELGMFFTFIILMLYMVIIIRIFINVKFIKDAFSQLVLLGIAIQITFQVFVNVGVNLNLLPTKGTILPFISYGGSSMVATAILLGILLAVNKKPFGQFNSRISNM